MQKDGMTSRERVAAAVKGLPLDRVPVMYWLNPHAACRIISEYVPAKSRVWNFLARRFWKNFKSGKRYSEDTRNALPLLLQLYANSTYPLELGADMANIPFGSAGFWGKLYRENGKIRAKDAFGSMRGMGGIYLEVIEPAIKDIEDLGNFRAPRVDPVRDFKAIKKYRAEHPEACIFTDNFGVQDLPATQIWNMEKFMLALYDRPDIVKGFQQRFADWNIDLARKSIAAGADVIFIYDDYGYTGRPLISMEMWKEFTFPHLKRQIEAIHEAGGLAMLHSCGYQMPFLPYYAQAELDILQTFQPKAGNDFGQAYADFGDRLTFNTGIDIQQGESMSAAEMKEDIVKAYRIGGMKGRHILGMTHMLQHTMPMENIKTIFETVREIQEGKI